MLATQPSPAFMTARRVKVLGTTFEHLTQGSESKGLWGSIRPSSVSKLFRPPSIFAAASLIYVMVSAVHFTTLSIISRETIGCNGKLLRSSVLTGAYDRLD